VLTPGLGRVDQRPALTRDVRGLLAVVAHPDDESFGLGALIDRFTSCGIPVGVLCFTHGEASTLHGRPGPLGRLRVAELRAAARVLGVAPVELLDYPDGRLAEVSPAELAGHVMRMVRDLDPSHLLVFDRGGITGHPDHTAATSAALDAARRAGLVALAWALPYAVAHRLNAEFGTAFVGRAADGLQSLSVSRVRQRRAIAAHASQSRDNPALYRRLALLRDSEHVRVLYRPA
jgi:LmbE family N-acetylglucosaminyl deacetylase